MDRLLAIVGPTGTGKTRLGIRLAQLYNGEIVSADSRQVYRHMDIGTAKPTDEELELVPHHLISIIDPDADFSLAQYQALAYQTIKDIHARGKLPVLVGGSGLYVWAVLEGWQMPRVPPDIEFRRNLEKTAAQDGAAKLHQRLASLDPAAAEEIDPRNIRRVIRALEVIQKTDARFSSLRRRCPPPYSALIIGLTAERTELYRRNDERVDAMVKRGLVQEVESLLKMGYGPDLPSMSSLGYRQVALYLKGELTLGEAIERMKFETHRFIRHQYAWYRLKDERIKWFDIGMDFVTDVEAQIGRWN